MIISIILKNNKDYEYLTKVYPQFNYIIMPKAKRSFYKAEEIQDKLKDFRYNKKHPVFFREADRFVNSILHIDNFVCARGKILTDLLNDIKRNNKIGLHAVVDSENPMNLCLVLSKKFGNTFWKIFGRNKEGEMYCRNYKFCVDGKTVQDTVWYRFILDCSKFPECPYNYRKLFLLLDLTIPPEERLRRVKEGLGFYANNTENIVLIKRNYVKIGNGKIEYIYELFTFNPQQPEEFTKRLREKYISLKEGQENN